MNVNGISLRGITMREIRRILSQVDIIIARDKRHQEWKLDVDKNVLERSVNKIQSISSRLSFSNIKVHNLKFVKGPGLGLPGLGLQLLEELTHRKG